ncbi:MAG TPA: flagellar basal body P-ring formation chaperone FlgA [Phycisphaerales bacterium]|nr:flagellar basal body P-ring formation chaperone FlgA [Phycisphaerales bacterium]
MNRTLAMLTLALAASAAPGQEITLRGSVRIEPGRPALLGDVADLAGTGADALARLVVAPDTMALASGWVRVDAAAIRAAIGAHDETLAELATIRGSACHVRAHAPPAVADDRPAKAAEDPAPDARRYLGEPTVRGHVATRIAWILGVDPADLRLSFEGSDADLLATPTADRVVEVQPTGRSDRLPLAVRVYDTNGIVATGTVRVGVLVRRQALVASRPLRRGEIVTAADVTGDEQWLAPGVRIAAPGDAIGAVVRGRIEPGELLTVDAIDAPIVVNKGDLVTISAVSPSVVVTEIARAAEAGRVGDVIRFESVDGRRRTFAARMSARGRALAWAGTTAVAAARENAP